MEKRKHLDESEHINIYFLQKKSTFMSCSLIKYIMNMDKEYNNKKQKVITRHMEWNKFSFFFLAAKYSNKIERI
jgi:hypothetical protein